MSAPATIEQIMKFLDSEETSTKVAEQKAAVPFVAAPLQTALSDAMASVGQAKVATLAEPVADLVKMANEVVAIDRDGEIKHAQLVGTAMADAFVSRINQWDSASASVEKTAAAAGTEAEQLQKFAEANPEAYESAVRQGYTDAKALIEKVGQDLYKQSFEAETAKIEKVAAEHFIHGWNAIMSADQILTAQARTA
jgi:hypothetical protein